MKIAGRAENARPDKPAVAPRPHSIKWISYKGLPMNDHLFFRAARAIAPAAVVLAFLAACLVGAADCRAATPLRLMKSAWTDLNDKLNGVAPTTQPPAAPAAADPGGINLLGVVYGTTSKIGTLPANSPIKQQYDEAGRQRDALDKNLNASWENEFRARDKIREAEYVISHNPARIAELNETLRKASPNDMLRDAYKQMIADCQAELSQANATLPGARAELQQAQAASQAIMGQMKPVDDKMSRLTAQAENQ